MNLSDLLSAMGKHNASDLHLRVGEPPVFRVGGDLVRLKSAALTVADLADILNPILDERLNGELKVRGYADFSHAVEGLGRFRCNVFKTLGRISAAIRRVKPNIPTYEELHLPPQIRKCAEFEQGLVLIGGITGSGKSTTIASILDDINHRRRCHILTIEDPVEYVFTDDKAVINQREVFTDVASFDDALRSCVREDPDVILLGEMRDAETFETALTAAETGHLVFGSVHSSGAPQTMGRIMDLFPSSKHAQIRTSLAFNLRCILNQKLLPGMTKGEMWPCVETMFIAPLIKKLIMDGEFARIADALTKDRENGCESYNQALHRLHKAGHISTDVALAAAPNAEELRMMLRGITISDGGIS
ncbi:MAG: PilT/PilU family type 4a pilus ATPase [Planctomycetota bacterium]